MTDAPPPVPPEAEQSTPPVRRRPRLRWWLLGTLVVLLGLLLFGLPLYGKQALALIPGEYSVRADSVGGPLWAPRLRGAVVRGPGVEATAKEADLGVSSLDLGGRKLVVNARLRDADVALDLNKLLGGTKTSTFTVLPSDLDLQNVRVNVQGRNLNLPDGVWRADGKDGSLNVSGRTKDGDLHADVRYATTGGQLSGRADLRADATVINHYWPGFQAGQISGRYTFGDQLRGDLRLSGGRVVVPGAEVVEARDIAGVVTQRGDRITAKLRGVGWDGPINATATVDTTAKNWRMQATATPTVAGLARALGTGGSGRLNLKVTAAGWTAARVNASLSGAGEVAGVPFANLNGRYALLDRAGGGGQDSQLVLSSDLRALGGRQRLSADLNLGAPRFGDLRLTGDLLQQPLDLRANLNGDALDLTGVALGGRSTAAYDLNSGALQADVTADAGGLRADLGARGRLENLNLNVRTLAAGPLTLSGDGQLSKAGVRLNLAEAGGGAIQARLDRQYKGSWTLDRLGLAGVSLDGTGRLDLTAASLNGQLAAALPLDSDRLSGPLALNWSERRGTWRFGKGDLAWTGQSVAATLDNLKLAGFQTSGRLNAGLQNGLNLTGRVTASGAPGTLNLTALGDRVQTQATLNGLPLSATTQLSGGFATDLRAANGDLRAQLSVQDGVRFSVQTQGDLVTGRFVNGQLNASGRVNLAALRAVSGVRDLAGTLNFNLVNGSGTGSFDVRAAGVTAGGTLAGRGGNLSASLNASGSGARAQLTGLVYPTVDVTGLLSSQGQRARLAVRGPYGQLGASLAGTSAPLTLSGVTLPGQRLSLSGTLTPTLQAAGTFGDLKLSYRDNQLSANGSQRFQAAGQSGLATLSGSWAPGWAGSVRATVVAGPYRVNAAGPWRDLALGIVGPDGLSGTGRANLADLTYRASLRGRLQGVYLNAALTGQRADFKLTATGADAAGGTLRLNATGPRDFRADLAGLTIAGQALNGQLIATDGRLNGDLSAGPLNITARNGQLKASGELSGTQIDATGQLTLPTTVTDLKVAARGAWGTLNASGDLSGLRGRVNLAAQSLNLSGVRASLPAQSFPLTASLQPVRAQVGGLTYAGGAWSGQVRARYTLAGQPGGLQLQGSGASLSALPTGPLSGRVQVLPSLSGELTADLSPFRAALPASVRAEVVPGRLRATIRPTGASIRSAGSRYVGQPLQLAATVSWQNGVRVTGQVTHPGSRIPFQAGTNGLTVRDLQLGALALRPFLPDASGQLRGNLSLPGYDLQRGNGALQVDLQSGGQRASGGLVLAAGQVRSDLSGDLGGTAFALSGDLYPRAAARLRYGDLRGTLNGRWPEGLTVQASGAVQGRATTLNATLSDRLANLNATIGGAQVRVDASRPASGAWRGALSLNAPDLQALTGQAGRVAGSLSGDLNRATGQFDGALAGAQFSLPVRYAGGAFSIVDGALSHPLASAKLSGQVYPNLQVAANATVNDYLPGRFRVTASGPLTAPDVRASGTLSAARVGLQAAGTAITARLSGQNVLVQASGEALAGFARLKLGSGPLGGLVDSRFSLNTAYKLSDTETVRLTGATGWNARLGWLGDLRAAGQAGGQTLDLRAVGNGPLTLSGTVRNATGLSGRLDGTLGQQFLITPQATVQVSDVDLGALWGKPGQLAASLNASVGGRWAALNAKLTGNLTDAAGELSGAISGQYADGRLDARLGGQKLNLSAQYGPDGLNASLNSSGASVARLLPNTLEVKSLSLAGQAQVRYTSAAGLSAQASNLDVRGEQTQVGPFSATGRLAYTPERVDGDLVATLRGGRLTVRGALPQGVALQTTGLDLSAFGTGTVNADLRLSGAVRDPSLGGTLDLSRPEGTAKLVLSGRVSNPRAHAGVTLRGEYGGQLYADLNGLTRAPLGFNVRLYGTAARGANRVDLDLAGRWPQLSGNLTAQVAGLKAPIQLTGDGRGGYALDAGELGNGQLTLSGLNPTVTASARLTPLGLLGASGTGSLDLSASGPVSNLQVAVNGAFKDVVRSGVTLPDLALSGGGPVSKLVLKLNQGGREVGNFDGSALKFDGLTVGAAGSTISLSGQASTAGEVRAAVNATGTIAGDGQLTYAGSALTLGANLRAYGGTARLDVRADQQSGWSGTGQVSELPGGILTRAANLRVSGPFNTPKVDGDLGLVGANVALSASTAGATLKFSDGTDAKASGTVNVTPAALSGQLNLSRKEGDLGLTLAGTPTDPRATVQAKVGGWSASGPLGLKTADLKVSDGTASGSLTLRDGLIGADLPGLDLGKLGLADLAGRVTARGQYSLGTQNGQLALTAAGLTTGGSLPVVNVPLAGDLSATASAVAGRWNVQARATNPLGSADATLQQGAGAQPWTGDLNLNLAQGSGNLKAALKLAAGGLSGTLDASAYPLSYMDTTGSLQGSARLTGRAFTVDASVGGQIGRATVTGGGGLADLYPPLTGLIGLQPTGEGYRVEAQASGVSLEALELAPYLTGRLSGNATFSDGGSTIALRAPDLKVGGEALPARVEGTLFGNQWRLRGSAGDSQLFGSFSEGMLMGRLDLRALPVSGLLGTYSGPLPGKGLLSGVARFSVPMADPLAGTVDLVAERVAVQSGDQKLVGTGLLSYKERELRALSLQLSGAGQWDVRGRYTRSEVNVRARFIGTTFTPVLSLIPNVRDQKPSLSGDLDLSIVGSYDKPEARLAGRNLNGALAGYTLSVPTLDGALTAGAFTASAKLVVGGTIASTGTVSAGGQFSGGKLSGTRASFDGDFAERSFGRLGRVLLGVQQSTEAGADTWRLDGTVTQGGAARIVGTLSPQLNLTLSARGLAPQLPFLYARETSLDADLSVQERGDEYVVDGAVTANRLVLGQVDAPAGTLPAPKTSATSSTDKFVSPLPLELSTFPAAPGQRVVSPFLNRIVLDGIPIRLPNGVRIDENYARAELQGGLTLSGRAADLRLAGEVRATRGSVFLRENEFRITSGVATFDGAGAYPIFDVQAAGTVRDGRTPVGIGLELSGNFPPDESGVRGLNLTTKFSCTANCQTSSGPYTEAQLYALVALGTPDLATVPGNLGGLGSSAVQTALNVFVLGEVERNLARAFGLDVFRIRTNLLSGDSDFSAEFTVGTYLSREFYLQYSVDLTGQGLLNAEYTTTDNRFTFKVSTPLSGLDLGTLQPSFGVALNLTPKSSINFDVQSGRDTTFKLGYLYRF